MKRSSLEWEKDWKVAVVIDGVVVKVFRCLALTTSRLDGPTAGPRTPDLDQVSCLVLSTAPFLALDYVLSTQAP